MQITYLGHAGFCVETTETIIIMDPWLSETGAFDAAWFQYPKNQFMHAYVERLLMDSSKERFIYISHEHQDHFDIAFLDSLTTRSFTLLLAHFDSPVVKHTLVSRHYRCDAILELENERTYSFKDTQITLFIIDTEMNCDSAILVQAEGRSFLNINDCKIHDILPKIVEKYGEITVFAAQFSGASWYPTCYEMTADRYRETCQEKVSSKFEATARAIEAIQPRVYLPSAGPPCFLDPLLLEINFQTCHTYPRAPALIAYLDQRLPAMATRTSWSDISPGDVLELASLTWTRYPIRTPNEEDYEAYVRAYAKEKAGLFEERALANRAVQASEVFTRLGKALMVKMQALKYVHQTVTTPLYWRLSDYPQQMYRLDLATQTLSVVSDIADPNCYVRITTPAWQMNKVLTRVLSWPDFALTLRVSLERVPDVYNTLIHGFLMLEEDKIESFCAKIHETNRNQERIVVDCMGKQYSILRYCPHQGADLSLSHLEGSLLICPRHQWKFDLQNQGNCIYNELSLEAVCLSE